MNPEINKFCVTVQVLALVKNGVVTDAVREGNRCVGLFNATPFFADDYSGQGEHHRRAMLKTNITNY
jgi:hypothetical protein